MKKIPTIFVRDSVKPQLVTPNWTPGCEWVRDGEGVATRKWDGTCVLVREGQLYKRRELRNGDAVPAAFEAVDTDVVTLKVTGWMPVDDGPGDQWHRAAFRGQEDGTYELVGPKIQGNKDGFGVHTLVPHGQVHIGDAPREFEALHVWFTAHRIEGLVWWHPDGRMAKIKRRDFGLIW